MAWRGWRPSTSTEPVVGLREAEDHVDGGGLAGAVGAEEGDDLALLEGEVDAADGVDGAEVLGDPGDLDGGHGPGGRCRAFPRGWSVSWLQPGRGGRREPSHSHHDLAVTFVRARA